MTSSLSAPMLLLPDQFDDYSAQWLALVASESDPELTAAFTVGKRPTTHVAFRADDIVQLLSAVSITTIKARFVLLPTDSDGHRFGIALFGTDSTGRRLTAYLANPAAPGAEGQEEAAELTSTSGPGVMDEVPNSLAKAWLQNWRRHQRHVSSQIFAIGDDFLRGYTFHAADFMDTLFGTPDADGSELQVGFAVHEFLPPHARQLTDVQATFGLVLDLRNNGQLLGDDIDPYYDISMPCPPTC